MPQQIKIWSAEQLQQMNEQRFLLEMLDMFKYAPENDGSEESTEKMKEMLHHVEQTLRARLAVKKR